MWEVVKRRDGVEFSVKQFGNYADASAYYEKAAKSINAKDEDGGYKLPRLRVSLRKTSTV